MVRVVFSFVLIFISVQAQGLERIVGKVTTVEPTYLPASISFRMDTGNAACPAGQWFKWKKTEENNKLVYSTLMAALLSGKKVNFYINDGDASCEGQYLHLRSD